MQIVHRLANVNAPLPMAVTASAAGVVAAASIGLFPGSASAVVPVAMSAFAAVHGAAFISRAFDKRLSREVAQRVRRMTTMDPLTSLPNRSEFTGLLAAEIAAASGSQIAVLSIDLDHFKQVNDLRGHAAGDEVLTRLASRMKDAMTDGEVISRTGGDGFSAFRKINTPRDAIRMAIRIQTALSKPLTMGEGDEITVDGSLGIAIYPQDDRTAEGLIGKSELAVFRAKDLPNEFMVFYEPTMDEVVRERRTLINDLRTALSDGQFELHYQVQESLTTNFVTGHEALLRWRHPKRGLVPPSDFIPLAEETKLIIPIGEWVLRQACHDAAARPELGRVAVNLSPVQFAQPNLREVIGEILATSGLEPERLEIELTESTLMSDPDRNLDILRTIQDIGVSVAMDDFGTGYSSLSALRSFRFDKIKLDRSFMPEVDSNPQAKAIIRAVLALGNSLGIPILAEGVETNGQLEFLRMEGCSEAQGYLLGKPEKLPDPPREMAALEEAI